MIAKLMERSVLIVEDEVLVADWLSMVVEEEGGIPVGPAISVAQALACLDNGDVSAAILDFNLRDGDATPIAIALKNLGIPFILHTGGILPARSREAFAGVPVFRKPASYDTLLRGLERAMTDQAWVKRHEFELHHALIVEDDDDMAVIAEAHLSRMGFKSIDRANGQTEAVLSALKRPPDFMLVDIRLDDGDGLSTAAAIQSLHGAVPALFMTAHEELAVGLMPWQVLKKPFSAAGFARSMATISFRKPCGFS